MCGGYAIYSGRSGSTTLMGTCLTLNMFKEQQVETQPKSFRGSKTNFEFYQFIIFSNHNFLRS